MGKIVKKLNLILLTIMISFSIYCSIYSVDAANVSLSEMQTQASGFISNGESGATNVDISEALGDFAAIGSILTAVGAGVMVGVVTYMGIKYLTAGPEAQAKLKVQLIGVVVSGMVIFGAYFIWKTVVSIANTF